MKKLILVTAMLTTFATPALAQTQGCTELMANFDTAISSSSASDEAKMKAVELREQGAKQQQAGDEKACVASLSAALQGLSG